MSDLEQLEATYAKTTAANSERGTVSLIVARVGDGAHECPPSGELTCDDGLVGDRWSIDKDPSRDGQVTLMMRGVAETIADGKPLHLPGDNFLVDLDLSEDNLPTGTRIRIGSAVLEVTAEPHTGCKKFSERFGSAALRWVNLKDNRPRRLRGVNCRVVEEGSVKVGDAAEVLR